MVEFPSLRMNWCSLSIGTNYKAEGTVAEKLGELKEIPWIG